MTNKDRHLAFEELLLFHDGEMNEDAARTVEAHLAACQQCSMELATLETTSGAVAAIYPREANQPAEYSGQHSEMRSRLVVALRQKENSSRLGTHSASIPWPLVYAATGLIGISLIAYTTHRHVAAENASAYLQERSLPDPRLTPGDVASVSYSDICPSKDSDQDPPVPVKVQQIVFDEYGVSGPHEKEHFQVDYLINPQLGGTSKPRNLWPQPYQSTVWNAYAKDALEDRLHTMVCQHAIGLSEAQHEIAKDWIEAYKKYFQTERPISNEARLVEKEDWGD